MIKEILSSFLTDFFTDEVKDATGSSDNKDTEPTDGKDPAIGAPIQKTMEDSVANLLGMDAKGNTKLDRYGIELENKAANYLAELTGINPATIKGDGKQKQHKPNSFNATMNNALNTVQNAASLPPTMRGVYASKIKQDNASAMFKNWGK